MQAVKRHPVLASAVAAAIALAIAVPVAAWAAVQENYGWYRGHESDTTYTIGTAGEMSALAKLVSGTADYDGDGAPDAEAVDFAGKAIVLSSGLPVNFMGGAIEPIGTQAHPFRGAFDGTGRQIDNFNLVIGADSTASVRDVGLFGYVGAGGCLRNVSVGPRASISIVRGSGSRDYIADVGMVAGYCAGSMEGCENAGELLIESEVAQRSADDFMPVKYVGGVVGQCVFDVSGCVNTGPVTVRELSSPSTNVNRPQLVGYVGGVVGMAGDATRVGTYDSSVFGEPERHGGVQSCANTGKVTVDTPKLAGLDRFGEQTNAESVAIGGVAGYSQGSVVSCTNGMSRPDVLGGSVRDSGYVSAMNGGQVGGIVGSLRGVLSDNQRIAYADDGANGADPLVVESCTNYGDVYGRVTVGGIVGKASSYTTIAECVDSTKRDSFGNVVMTYVVATRWNKPSPGGIAGTANGIICYCANLATVASGEWRDEAARTLVTKDGYYAAGIAGTLTYFDESAEANGGMKTPVSEAYSCYNAGTIIAGANMRQRGIVGQNNGFVHDNVLLKGVVYDDDAVYGDSPQDSEASGTVGDNRVVEAPALRGDKASEAVAFLNSNSAASGWERYWVVSAEAGAGGENDGYPLLDRQDPWGDAAMSIADATVALTKDAAYSGGESLPEVRVVLGGVQLVANADYRVIAQPGATEPAAGAPYSATVVGIGRYRGQASRQVAYGIGIGELSACTVTCTTHTFDYAQHVPSAADVVVRTPAGTVVDASEYSFGLVSEDGGPVEAVDAAMYRLLVSAGPGSVHFKGQVEGQFRIKPASFMREVDLSGVTVSYLGRDYPWIDSKTPGESDNPSTVLPYTGVPVKPVVGAVTYEGHTLVEGRDYRIVYGNRNSDDGYTGDYDRNNAGAAGGTSVGCVTIRYINGGETNFSSYANMFFRIVDGGAKADLSQADYRVDSDLVADGHPLEPVELYLGAMRLEEGVDYAIEYRDNVEPGTATFTATGLGSFSGELSGEFSIGSGVVYELSYSFDGDGSASHPFEATVLGVEYHGSRDAFDLVIPDTVEHGGRAYAVTAVGDGAFGGSTNADYEGTRANESKRMVGSVSVPATVRRVGSRAFGSSSSSLASDNQVMLESVVFEDGSELASIGDYAFAQCKRLVRIDIPAGVEAIGRAAFASCESLREMRFMTERADMPSSVATGATSSTGAFYNCSGVVVCGYESASAVRALAWGNAGAGNGANGGRSFTFSAFARFADARIEAIGAQTYTGSGIEPAVKVTLAGVQLAQDVDFTVSFEDNVDVGMAHLVARGIGRYLGQVEGGFAIEPLDLRRVEFADLGDVMFTGEPVSFSAVLVYRGRALVEGVDYELAYADAEGEAIAAPSGIGSYRLKATGLGNFAGGNERAFNIVTASLADAVVDNVGAQGYTGAPVEPAPTVRVAGRTLARDVDYVVGYRDNVAVGDATLVVTGIGGYVGEASARFQVARASLADAVVGGVRDVSLRDVAGMPFDGSDGTAAFAAPAGGTAAGVTSAGSGSLAAGASGAFGSASGSAAPFDLFVVVHGTALVRGEDFSFSVVDARGDVVGSLDAAGEYRVVVEGMGNYQGTVEAAFSAIDGDVAAARDLSRASASLPAGAFDYDGTLHMPAPTVTVDGVELTVGRDFVTCYEGNFFPGAAVAEVRGIGEWAGCVRTTFHIAQARIAEEGVSLPADVGYTGSAHCPKLAVRVGKRSLVEGVDFSLRYEGNVDAGQAHVAVVGMGGYTGEVSVPFLIAPADLSGAGLSAGSQTYTGDALCPDVSVVCGSTRLSAGSDYTVGYAGNVDAGTATVTVTGAGNYAGQASCTFTIARASMGGVSVEAIAPSAYTGGPCTPAVHATLGSYALRAGSDYVVTYRDNVNAGTGKAVIAGRGNFEGAIERTFAIAQANIGQASIGPIEDAVYAGRPIEPSPVVSLGGAVLRAGVDYALSYADNVDAGNATVVVSGRGNYAGTARGSFTIRKALIGKGDIAAIPAKTYTGKALSPAPVVKVGGVLLAAGADYSVRYASNVKPGKATVAVTGIGNYAGSVKASFTVKKASIASAKFSKVKKQRYRKGKAVKPTVVVKFSGKKLKKGVDYQLSYKNNKKRGTATIVAKGKGSCFKGKKTIKFKIR